jgi:hypothetical protein
MRGMGTYKSFMFGSAKEKVESMFSAGRAALRRLLTAYRAEAFDGGGHLLEMK